MNERNTNLANSSSVFARKSDVTQLTNTVNNLAIGLEYITSTTFTNASSIVVNNCFTGTYNNYRIVLNITNTSGAAFMAMLLRANNVDNSANYSYVGVTYYLSGGSGYSTIRAGQNIGYWVVGFANGSGAKGNVVIEVFNPSANMTTTANWTGQINDTNTGVEPLSAGGIHLVSYQATGFKLVPLSGVTYTGTVRIYGYKQV